MQKSSQNQRAEESDELSNQDGQNSYNSHSDLSRYQTRGLCNKGFSSSRENNITNEMLNETPNKPMVSSTTIAVDVEKVPQNNVEYPISNLPLVDSLLSNYKSESFGCKTPLVPPRRSRDHSKERIVKDRQKCTPETEPSLCNDAKSEIDPSEIVFYPEHVEEIILARKSPIEKQSRGIQVWPSPPYRLKVLPSICSGKKFKCSFKLVVRLFFSQIGLGSVLIFWALVGATAFRYTEGPREEKAAQELISKQKNLVNSLAIDLRKDFSDSNEWNKIIEKYMAYHENVLTENGNMMGQTSNGHVWTLPGCLLFAVSIITTLGFGAPVPKTPEGRGVTVAFAAVGIPLHLLLVLNIGMAIAVKLQSLTSKKLKTDKENQENGGNEISKTECKIVDSYHKSNRIFSANRHKRTGSEPIGKQALNNITNQAGIRLDQSKEIKYFYITEIDNNKESNGNYNLDLTKCKDSMVDAKAWDDTSKRITEFHDEPEPVSRWLKWLPFIGIFIYYTMGFLLFGIARCHSFLDSLMFPLDFTVVGGVAQTPGFVRILYALYLEGAVVLMAVTVSVLQVSATQGLTNVGLKYDLLTNSR